MADISKIKLANNTVVTLKDAQGRTNMDTLLGTGHTAGSATLGGAAWLGTETAITTSSSDSNVATAKATKEYVDAQIGTINKFDVKIYETLPTASADTMYILGLVKDETATAGTYTEYITVRTEVTPATDPKTYTYAWEKIGSTQADLTDYVKKSRTIAGVDLQDDITQAELQTALGLKALAYKDNGKVTISTADDLTMDSYTPEGKITVNDLVQTSTAASLTKGDYTPAGSITGTAINGGSISVTVKDAASATAVTDITYEAYTPTGSVALTADNNGAFQVAGTNAESAVTVNTSNAAFVQSLTAGETNAASFQEGAFTPASIDASKFFNAGSLPTKAADSFNAGSFTKGDAVNAATEGVVATVNASAKEGDDDYETLVFTNAATDAVMDHNASFVAPTFTEGTFTQGSLPSIDVTNGFNGGSKAADTFSAEKLPVVGDTAKALTEVTSATAAAQTFTGNKYTPAFTGTSADIKMNGAKYLKQEINTATFTGNAATLGFSGTKAENILVTGVTYDKATANGATFTGNAATLTGTINKSDKEVSVSFGTNA